MSSWEPGGGVSSAILDFVLDFVMAGFGVLFEAVVVVVVLEVEPLQLFGINCAV